jgi:hypothetical protein
MKALLAILIISLAACTDREAAAPREETRDPSVFDSVTIDPMNRARGVEDTLRDSAADRRRQIEEAADR